MKSVMTLYDRVRIPTRTISQFALGAAIEQATSYADFGIREIVLKERELNGIMCKVAYDHETDTLYIHDASGAFG